MRYREHYLRKSAPFVDPPIHDIGKYLLEACVHYADRPLFFLITACGLTLERFRDFGYMAGVKGVEIRLGGRICNTFRAFELSEHGWLGATPSYSLGLGRSLHEAHAPLRT